MIHCFGVCQELTSPRGKRLEFNWGSTLVGFKQSNTGDLTYSTNSLQIDVVVDVTRITLVSKQLNLIVVDVIVPCGLLHEFVSSCDTYRIGHVKCYVSL